MTLPPLVPSLFGDPRMCTVGASARGRFVQVLFHVRLTATPTRLALVPGRDAAWLVGAITRSLLDTAPPETVAAADVAELMGAGLLAVDGAVLELPACPELAALGLQAPAQAIAAALSTTSPVAADAAPAQAFVRRRAKGPTRETETVQSYEVTRGTFRSAHARFKNGEGPFAAVPEGTTWEAWLQSADAREWARRMHFERLKRGGADVHNDAEARAEAPAPAVVAPPPAAPARRPSAPPVAPAPALPTMQALGFTGDEIIPLIRARCMAVGNREAMDLVLITSSGDTPLKLQRTLNDLATRYGYTRATYETYADYVAAGGLAWRKERVSARDFANDGWFAPEIEKALLWAKNGRKPVLVRAAPTGPAKARGTLDESQFNKDPAGADPLASMA